MALLLIVMCYIRKNKKNTFYHITYLILYLQNETITEVAHRHINSHI